MLDCLSRLAVSCRGGVQRGRTALLCVSCIFVCGGGAREAAPCSDTSHSHFLRRLPVRICCCCCCCCCRWEWPQEPPSTQPTGSRSLWSGACRQTRQRRRLQRRPWPAEHSVKPPALLHFCIRTLHPAIFYCRFSLTAHFLQAAASRCTPHTTCTHPHFPCAAIFIRLSAATKL
jgi:hypothetical protein